VSYFDPHPPQGYPIYSVEAHVAGDDLGARSEWVRAVPLPSLGSGLTLQPPCSATLPAATSAALTPAGKWVFALQDFFNVMLDLPSPTGWDPLVLSTAVSLAEPGVLVDAQGRPHGVFTWPAVQGSRQMVIEHVWHDGSTWRFEEIARRPLRVSSPRGPGIAFALDDTGAPRLCWYNAGADAPSHEFAARNLDGTWSTETLDGAPDNPLAIAHSRLAVDASGVPWFLLSDGKTLALARRQGAGAWTWETVPSGSITLDNGSFQDLACTDAGTSVFFARRSATSGLVDLCEIRKTSSTWGSITCLDTARQIYFPANSPLARTQDGTRLALTISLDSGNHLYLCDQGAWTSHLLGPWDYG
jgi:hypothetical protein